MEGIYYLNLFFDSNGKYRLMYIISTKIKSTYNLFSIHFLTSHFMSIFVMDKQIK